MESFLIYFFFVYLNKDGFFAVINLISLKQLCQILVYAVQILGEVLSNTSLL